MLTCAATSRCVVLKPLKMLASDCCARKLLSSSFSVADILKPETSLTDLKVHKLDVTNEGDWMFVSKDAYDRLSFSSGLRKSMQRQVDAFRECRFMIRYPALDVINCLKATKSTNPAFRYIFYGKYGCGKTISLHHVLYWAYEQGWTVCFFPRTYIYRRNVNECIQSTWKSNRLDLPGEASLWLSQFQKANEDILQDPNLVTTKDYNWAPREFTKKGSPLRDIITMGIARIKTASDCLAALLRELLHYSSTKKIKMLVVIEQLNSLFGPTLLRRPDNYYAQPSDVTIMRAILKLLKSDWTNGAVVSTVDSFEIGEHLPSSPANSHLPFYLLQREGLNALEPYLPVEVPPYSHREASKCIDYYQESKWLVTDKAHLDNWRKEAFQLTGLNPLSLYQLCGTR